MKTTIRQASYISDDPHLIRLRIGLVIFFSGALLIFTLLTADALRLRETFANVARSAPRAIIDQKILQVDPPCGALGGIAIDHMEAVGNWQAGLGNGAVSATLTIVPGTNGQAIRLSYNLGTTPGAYVQLRRDFGPTLNLSAGDHLRFFHKGTTTNTLEVGLTSDAGENYFGSGWKEATQVPWWTYATWDFQDFRKDDTEPYPDFSKVKAIFISVAKKDDDVGGIGSITIDELQYLKIATRTVPSGFELLTVVPPITQQAALWVGTQQQASGLPRSWPEEYQQDSTKDFAWLYDIALELIVLSEMDMPRANQLVTTMHNLQNADGSWFVGYHFSTTLPITTTKPVGANAWMVYSLMRYFLESGSQAARQDALEGAAWLAARQRPDGSLPGELKQPPDTGAPTEANLDAWWAFQATGYYTQADNLKGFLLNEVWDDSMGRFKSSGNTYPPRDRYQIFLDNQTWGAAFLHAVGRDMDARRALSYARWTLSATSSDGSICGFDGAGPFSVWNEGTLQYIAAHGENSQYYWGQMAGQQSSADGLPGSPDEFRGYTVWLTRMRGVAPTSWLYFAGTGGPFYVTQRVFLPTVRK